MDDFVRGLTVVTVGLLLFFASFFIFLQSQHRWNVGRDMYMMSHCKVMQRVVGSTDTKEYRCEQQ